MHFHLQLIQLLVVADSKLDVARDDTAPLIVTSRIPRELEDLCLWRSKGSAERERRKSRRERKGRRREEEGSRDLEILHFWVPCARFSL